MAEIVEKRRLHAIFSRQPAPTEQQATQYATALLRAAETSAHTLSPTYEVVSLTVVANAKVDRVLNEELEKRSIALRGWHPAMPLLGHRLREFMLGRSVANAREYNRTQLPPLGHDRIRVHKSAVLAADMEWEPDSFVLQTVRANNSFYGKPFFDCVAVREAAGSSNRQGTRVAHARLLLLFEAKLFQADGREQWEELAYVSWFKMLPRKRASGPLVKYGAVPLEVETTYDPATGQQGSVRCGIVPLSALIRREYVVQDFKNGRNRFYVSHFKY